LRLVRWSPEHGDLLARLGAIPEVVRFIADGRPWQRERALEWSLRAGDHWDRHGFGWRCMVERETGTAVGFIGLNLLDDEVPGLPPGEHEIGWWLDPAFGGRGFATEGARAVYEEALTTIGLETLVARIQAANEPSRRVAERLGMRLELETTGVYGAPLVVYRAP
jgi:RimJ/RimL family protein N-acetyltransferase